MALLGPLSTSIVEQARVMAYKWSHNEAPDVRIRRASDSDAAAVRRLEQLAESRPLAGELLVAEVDGELCAAYSFADGSTIGDPFRPTLAVRELLALRARQLAHADDKPRAARRLGWRRLHASSG
jgi:hypothetical protein